MFQFVAYSGAIDSRLIDLLVLGETRDAAAMRNIHMDPDTRALRAQLCYMLILVCQEGAQGDTEGGVAWRRLLESMSQGPQDGSVPCCKSSFTAGFPDTCEQPWMSSRCCFARYSALSGEDVSERLKVALVRKGITDDALKTHLARFKPSNFQLIREEVRSVLITRQALSQGPAPMDIGALDAKGKGKSKGKSKDKGKAKDKPDAEMTCYYCGKVGHRKADCWSWQAAQKEKEKDPRRV